MSWQQLRGHDRVLEQFRRALVRGRLASTFLFVGPAGIGKRAFAIKLAGGLLCERVAEERLDPCGECPSCRQVMALSHPDVEFVRKPADKNFIPVELLIGDVEHRMRAGLCYNIALKPYSGRRKVAIIDDADSLNKEGANCLLKTLEEPPLKSVLILIGTSEQRQLPTIRSRCQIVRFQPLPEQDVAELLIERGLCDDPALARQAAARSGGSVVRAAMWCDESLVEFRGQLLEALALRDFDPLPLAKLIGQFADSTGKESAAKRERLRLVISMAEEFFRALVLAATAGRQLAGNHVQDGQLGPAIDRAMRWLDDAEVVAACLDVCLDAYAHIDANANQALLIDWWLDELGQAASSKRAVVRMALELS
jgi:DNA polymerase-3 subunit delta'